MTTDTARDLLLRVAESGDAAALAPLADLLLESDDPADVEAGEAMAWAVANGGLMPVHYDLLAWSDGYWLWGVVAGLPDRVRTRMKSPLSTDFVRTYTRLRAALRTSGELP